MTLLQNDKVTLDRTKHDLTFEVGGLKEQVKTKDRLLEQLKGQLEESEKVRTDSAKKISELKEEIKYVEDQWAKSATKIKENFLAQAKLICLEADFNDIELHLHVVDGRIVDIPVKDDNAKLGSNLVNPETDPKAFYLCI